MFHSLGIYFCLIKTKNILFSSQLGSLIGSQSPNTTDETNPGSDTPSTSKTIAEIYSEADSKHASKQTRRISGTIAEIYAKSNSPSPPLIIAEINCQSLPTVAPKSFETEANTAQSSSPSPLPTLAENITTQSSQTTKTIAEIYGHSLPSEAPTSRERSHTCEPTTTPSQTSQPKKKTIAYIYGQSLGLEAPSSSKISSQIGFQSLTTRSSKKFRTTKIKNILVDNNTTPVQMTPRRVGLRDSNYQ